MQVIVGFIVSTTVIVTCSTMKLPVVSVKATSTFIGVPTFAQVNNS